MGDGSKHKKGLLLCTNSYKIEEVIMLMNVLIIRYRLNCTLRFHSSGGPMIYIQTNSMPLLRSIVLPHMYPSMLHTKVLYFIFELGLCAFFIYLFI